jgi:tetratricopeptide (TPR) repeat protein
VLAAAATAWPPERYLSWAEPPLPTKQVPGPAAKRGLAVASREASPADCRVDALQPGAEIAGAVEEVARLAAADLRWLNGAREILADRRIDLACRGIAVRDLLHWLALPHGLAVEVEGRTLTLRPLAALPPAGARASRKAEAQQALKAALAAARDHPFVGDVYVALGNLVAHGGKAAQPAGWFERLAREQPRSGALAAAFYNLGLLRLRQGDRLAARAAFFRAIDHAPGSELVGLCRWWVGRSCLDEKDLLGALAPLSRARQAAGPEDIPAAVLGLACLHLIEGQPAQALKQLHGHKAAIRRRPFAGAAAFLDAYARHRLLLGDPKKSPPVLAELVAVLLEPHEAPWLGPALPYLEGQAMRELGLNQEMVALYDRATRSLQGPLADEMNLQSAEVLVKAGRPVDARPRLEALAKVPSPRRGSPTRAPRSRRAP